MIAELGQFALILALALTLAQVLVPAAGVFADNSRWMASARSLALGQFVFVAISYACLTLVFLQDDFSVALVASHSNTLLPTAYKFSAVWGNHEGSLLLWILILAFWIVAVARFSRALPLDMVARVLSVMAMVSAGFMLLSLLTSNPFERLLPNPPLDGADLNPLLQDPGLILHPPLLYLGYVGFSVVFAFAIAALWSGRLDIAWARWSRPWTGAAWLFLTLGIAIGSWWAYYTLGWGGWWFWDPVENASFMPWLAGTALLHSLAVTEKRGLFRSWTVLLAIFTFSLSLLGTFLVRSGVLTSVHSFAADPTRGLFILAFLGVVVGGSLTLYALRAPTVRSGGGYALVSREMLLLLNNLILMVATLTVLIGTLFPLVADALGMGKYSVGPPYFNAMFLPLMAVLMVFMGFGPGAAWKRSRAAELGSRLFLAAAASLVVGLVFPFAYQGAFNPWVALTVVLGSWLILATLRDVRDKLRNAPGLLRGLRRLPLSWHGMIVAHLGMAVTALGIGLTSQYTVERDVRAEPGQSHELGAYSFRFEGTELVRGPNFVAEQGHFVVSRGEREVAHLYPQKRRYLSDRTQLYAEVGLQAGFFRDLYVAMGEPLDDEAWAVRLHVKPFVRWIWLGCLLMVLGAGLAASDRRYRKVASARQVDTAEASLP